MVIFFIIFNVILILLIRVYLWLSCGKCRCSRHLVGKVVIVTGANSGIGYETAKDLAARGARVILACRNEGRGTAARDRIAADTGHKDVHFRRLDLASLASVRAFADHILKTESRLDILINNAGVYSSKYKKTEDGLLYAMQSNHFGHFLLTSLLLPLLKSSAPSRIINVSSVAYQYGKIDFDNLNWEKGSQVNYNEWQVYSNSKLCNVLFTTELDRRLRGTGVTANCLHPGVVESNIKDIGDNVIVKHLSKLGKLITKSPWEGTQNWLVNSGKYRRNL